VMAVVETAFQSAKTGAACPLTLTGREQEAATHAFLARL